MNFVIKTAFTAVLVAACAGCLAGPSFRAPEAPAAKTYTAADLPAGTASWSGPAGPAQLFVQEREIPAQWWTLFQSAALDKVIRQALLNNPTLRAAGATLRQAQENLKARAGSALLPDVDLDASVERQQISGAVFGEPDTSINPFTIYNASVRFSYALDLFGGARRELQSLRSQVDFQRFELEGAYLTITSNVVTAAVKEASLRGRLQAMREIVAVQEKLLDVFERQFELGAISVTDVLAQRAELAQTRASLPRLEKDLAGTRHQLAILSGVAPVEAALLPQFDLRDLQLPRELPVSLPSSLVRQRPDIRGAEALLHAASAEIGVATANLYPQITLNAGYGSSATAAGSLFSGGTAVWNLGAGLLQPLFRGGELTAKRRAAIAAYEQADARYRSIVLQAFGNVADVLQALEADARALKAQGEAEAAARDAFELTRQQLSLGAVNYLALLNAMRLHEQARIDLVEAQAARFADTAALFQALGGGWWNRDQGETRSNSQVPDDE